MKTARQSLNRPATDFRDPTNSMGYLSRVAFRRFAKAIENRTLEHGVSGGQWRFLRVLWREDGITQSELSRRVDMREPTTVVAIRGLERSGLVYRRADPDDQRKVRVLLTSKARALEPKLIPYVAEVNAIAARGIRASDLRIARKVLMILAENLASEASDRPAKSPRVNRKRLKKG